MEGDCKLQCWIKSHVKEDTRDRGLQTDSHKTVALCPAGFSLLFSLTTCVRGLAGGGD